MKTNADIKFDGEVTWYAPAIFKSSCRVNIKYFPFDEQSCLMKFGSWAFQTNQLDLINRSSSGDIESFIDNGEWNLNGMPVVRVEAKYDCCEYPYAVLDFRVNMNRRSLFYVFNLLVPCMLVSALTMLCFYLPADAGEKVTLCITILLSLTVFLLLVAETMPPTSDVIPLIGKCYDMNYLNTPPINCFTIILISNFNN